MPHKTASIKQYDSSITRVWPVFQPLLRRDPTGLSWLPQILALAQAQSPLVRQIFHDLTPLLPACLQKRRIGSKNLKYCGVSSVEMEACFERSLPPSAAFLRWLIRNPHRLTWPRQGRQKFSPVPQAKRQDLVGLNGVQPQALAQAEALAEIDRLGAGRSHRKWWGFEGVTYADCCLETANLVLLIEGKRTETLSTGIDWYPGRNQLLRNLEVTGEIASSRNFAVLVIAETPLLPPAAETVQRSLPHLSGPERDALLSHYLGCLTWKDVCQSVGLSYDQLPATVADWSPS